MRLLIITQKVDKNDDVLGFFHAWVKEFAKHCEKVTVICLEKGEYDLPENVKVLSLGKEQWSEIRKIPFLLPAFFFKKIRYTARFYSFIVHERRNYDTVFVHMNPEYVLLAGLFWRMLGKRIALWYTHRNTDLKLRIAERFAHVIFTSAKESFCLSTKKLFIVGHGIDVAKFKRPENFSRTHRARVEIISVGRITPIKNLDTMIKACAMLKIKDIDFRVRIIGAPTMSSDDAYFEKLKKLIAEKHLGKDIEFLGSIPNKDIPPFYWESDFEVNLCPTGGIDKAVIESMAAGVIPIVSNKGYVPYFCDYAKTLVFQERNATELSEKIIELVSFVDQEAIRKYVEEKSREFDTSKIIQKIILHIS